MTVGPMMSVSINLGSVVGVDDFLAGVRVVVPNGRRG